MVEGQSIEPKPAIRYLGIVIDKGLTFTSQVTAAAERAAKTTQAISRIMPNIGGPSSAKRKILATVPQSILLYGAEIWGEALQKSRNNIKISRIQRQAALRVCCGYRTVSTEAALVIAGIIPLTIAAEDRREKRHGPPSEGGEEGRRTRMLDTWQKEWDRAAKGAWTKKLIPDLRPWAERKHGRLTYNLTQFLSGHGCYGDYLEKKKKWVNDRCPYCNGADSPEHTIFLCDRWERKRAQAQAEAGFQFESKTLIKHMLDSEKSWSTVAGFIETVMAEKQIDERRRQADVRAQT